MKKQFKTKFIIGGIVILAAIGYLFYMGVSSNQVYYVSPTELLAKGQQAIGLGARLAGRVEDGSINYNNQTLDLSFKVTDGKNSIPITYHGVVPDTFKYGVDVIVEGKLQNTSVFAATKLMAKCPSKYEPQKIQS